MTQVTTGGRRAAALGRPDLPAIVEVLRESFVVYPVMRYVLGRTPRADDPHLATLLRFFATARLLRGEPVLGVRAGDELAGVALVSFPDGPSSPVELARCREETWEALGGDARARYERFGEACAPFFPDSARTHLNMIGVRPTARGTGIARLLVDAVVALAATRPGTGAVTLTTEDPANLPIYRRIGFLEVGHARVDSELESWGMARPPA
jgi:GNAT superfamily N-acetyltransferase